MTMIDMNPKTQRPAPKRPTHRAYSVTRLADNGSSWREIGAAWPHEDGLGFHLKLNLLPLDGSDIVVRQPKTAA